MTSGVNRRSNPTLFLLTLWYFLCQLATSEQNCYPQLVAIADSSGLPLDVFYEGNSLPLSSCANPDITVVPVPTILDLTCDSYNSDPEPSLSWTTSNNVPFTTDDAVFVNNGNRYNASMTVHLNLTQKGIDFTATCGFNVAGSAAQSVCVRITTGRSIGWLYGLLCIS